MDMKEFVSKWVGGYKVTSNEIQVLIEKNIQLITENKQLEKEKSELMIKVTGLRTTCSNLQCIIGESGKTGCH